MGPVTRSGSRRSSEGEARFSEEAINLKDEEGPKYRTRSQTRLSSDSPSKFEFPFFDESNTSMSRNYDLFQSPKPTGHGCDTQSNVETFSSEDGKELSPICKDRGSDASEASFHFQNDGIRDENQVPQDQTENEQDTEVETSSPAQSAESKQKNEIQDLSSARKLVGQTANAFIERIRNAAHKRKVAMARSKDSLVAKEEEQLRSIAEAKAKAVEEEVSRKRQVPPKPKSRKITSTSQQAQHVFKARPLPATTGAKGSGGLEGVPKVAKKPVTTPFSPLLGARRRGRIQVKALAEPKQQQPRPPKRSTRSSSLPARPKGFVRPFKARPVPLAVGSQGYGGQYGVPKVQKRPTTVARSPLLGPRRRTRSFDASSLKGSKNCSTMEPRNRPSDVSLETTKSSDTKETIGASSSQSPTLLGLGLLDSSTNNSELRTSTDDENLSPRKMNGMAFEPRSTTRAKKRAAHDEKRDTLLQAKTKQKNAKREKEIRRIRHELQLLRPTI